jgi:hypothetical protein
LSSNTKNMGWTTSFSATRGTSGKVRPTGRSATVTPSAKRAQGAADA